MYIAAYMVYNPVIVFEDRDPDDLRKKLKMYLEPSQRPVVISSIAIPAAAAAAKALDILCRDLDLRRKLWDNTYYAKNRLRELGFAIDDSPVPVICLHSLKSVDFQALQLELYKKTSLLHILPAAGIPVFRETAP